MRRLGAALLLAACASGDRAPVTVEEPGRIVAEAELAVGSALRVETPPALILELRPSTAPPPRLGKDLKAGRSWLVVERPRGFSFVGRDLLAGDALFRPGAAMLLFVQPRDGPPSEVEPALLRLSGRVAAEAMASRIETTGDPSADGEELAEIESADLRVLLGRGLDTLLVCVGSTDMDTHHWIRVVDADGGPAEWRRALDEAREGRRLEPLAPYRVLVRRRRPGDPVPVHYRVRLADVVAAAQMRLVAQKDAFEWTWEGVWTARLSDGSQGAGTAAWPPEAPPLQVRYKEYVRPSGDVTGTFWRGLLAPLALGADVGLAILEGEPLVDSVAERQRARN
jgi:hypothetical protein